MSEHTDHGVYQVRFTSERRNSGHPREMKSNEEFDLAVTALTFDLQRLFCLFIRFIPFLLSSN